VIRALGWVLVGAIGGLRPAPWPTVYREHGRERPAALVEQLTAERAITLANAQRKADAAQTICTRGSRSRIGRCALRSQGAAMSPSWPGAQGARRDRPSAQELIAALAQATRPSRRDQRVSRGITKLASSPDPQKQKALQRFADGEQNEALGDLDLIADARRAAHRRAAAKASTSPMRRSERPTAWLTVQPRRGQVTLDNLVGRSSSSRGWIRMTHEWNQLAVVPSEVGSRTPGRGEGGIQKPCKWT